MTNPRDTKRAGTIYEQIFIVRALEEGLEPHPTTGAFFPHDILVTTTAGTSFRVQVKGTANPKSERRATPRFRITAGTLRAKVPLDCSKVDVLAAYVTPVDVWYIIPCLKIKAPSIWFYPGVEGSKAYYEQFRENWDFFR